MKKLLKKSISFFLSLSLVLGLATTPSMVAKATASGGETTTFDNFEEEVDFIRNQSAQNGLSCDVNGYKFTMYTTSDLPDSSFSVEYKLIGGSYGKYLRAWIDCHPDYDEVDRLIHKLVISRSDGKSFDLDSVVLAYCDAYTSYTDIKLTGYKKDIPVDGAIANQSGNSIKYKEYNGGDNLIYDLSDKSAFKGIDSFVISGGLSSKVNVGYFIKSITASEHQETTNTAPTAKNVNITPDSYGEYLDGIYDFQDAEGDDEGESSFQWYRSDDSNGTNEVAIPEATAKRYVIQEEDFGKCLWFEVTPKDAGGLAGNPVRSGYFEIMQYNNPNDAELNALKVAIESYTGGGNSGIFQAEVNKEDKTVTVTGIAYMANQTLALTIPAGVKVIWDANFNGNGNNIVDLLRIDGAGSFELAENGALTMNDDSGLYDHNALKAGNEISSILIKGGAIDVPSGHAIYTSGDKTSVEVSGGTLNSFKGDTLYTAGSNSVIKISGGGVYSSDGASINSNSDVLISGGRVDNNAGRAVYSGGNVIISGNAFVTSGKGIAIELKKAANIEVTGGIVFARVDMNSNAVDLYRVPRDSQILTGEGYGTMIAWERTNKNVTYTYGTKNDLYTIDSKSVVKWTVENNIPGIMVDNGNYKQFIPIFDVTVTGAPETPVNRTVTFEYGDRDPIKESVPDGTSLGSDIWPADPVRAGYTFGGWYTGENGSGTAFTSDTAVNTDIIVYAKWVPVTENPDKVTVTSVTIKSAPAKTAYHEGEALELSGLVVTLNKSDGSSEDVPYEEFATKGITTNPANGKELITESSVVIITYTADNRDVLQKLTITPAGAENHTVTFQYGGLDTITKSAHDGKGLGGDNWPADPVKAGYTFDGWFTGENGTGSAFTSGTIVNADITVYAKWSAIISGPDNNNPGTPSTGTPSAGTPTSGTPSTGTPSSGTEQITVDVKQGNTNSVASQITIERTTKESGEKSDKVTYQKDKAAETVQKLKAEGKDTARIVIPDEKNEVSETRVNIPVASLGTLADGEISLQIDTEKAKISLPGESVKSTSQSLADDLYFRLVPVKNDAEKKTISNQARLNAALVSSNTNAAVSVIGNPITIETNMPSTDTEIILPLTGITIPASTAAREDFIKQLAVYIEHSDGDKELVQGELVEYKEGLYGIRFHISKFSTFTVVKTDAFLKSATKEITKITVPSNAVIKGSSITASVSNEISSLTVKAAVSKNAAWKLYTDKTLKKEAANGKLVLKTGVNTSYIKVTAQNKTTKVYKLSITRNKSAKAVITKVLIPEKATIKGDTITATVAKEKTSLTINSKVSSKATLKLYSDKALKKELSNSKVNLKEGANTVYLKVTAENGTSSKVYTLKITRKGQVYKSHVSLGLIGSKDYANNVAKIFEQDYKGTNVVVEKKGEYYLVSIDFKDETAAKTACEDMIRRGYIINYYFK